MRFAVLKSTSVLASLFAAVLPSPAAAQLPLEDSDPRVDYPFGRPVNPSISSTKASLSSLSTDSFATFAHSSQPAYGLRVKKTNKDFCDPDVNAYTGYLDVAYGTKHLFFYFFESRNDPARDDVLMWINGGPGCSSSTGLFMELGPCSVRDPEAKGLNATEVNTYAWNSNANLFLLDQPYVA